MQKIFSSLLTALCLTATAPAATNPPVRIGTLAWRGPEACLAEWGPTADYLTEQIPEQTFEIVPLPAYGLLEEVAKERVDFMLVNGETYAELFRALLHGPPGDGLNCRLVELTVNGKESLVRF